VQPSSGTVVRPGQTASYVIWVWAAGRASNPAVVRIQATRAVGVAGPRFVTCPHANGTSCSVGRLSVNQSGVLAASVSVSSQAIGGELLQLSATVSAAGVSSASAWTVIAVVTPTPGDPSGRLTPTALELGQVGGDVPPLLPLPGVAPVNPTSLFPSVSPGSGSGSQAPGGASRRSQIEAVTAGAATPTKTVIGAQLVGIAVLAVAIVIGFVRVSLRVPWPSGGPDQPKQSSAQQSARPRPGWTRRWYTRSRRAK
jgi:hypothetical protein